jgi:hypothetical protein
VEFGVRPFGHDDGDVTEDRGQVQLDPVGVGAQATQVDPHVAEDALKLSRARMPTISADGAVAAGRSASRMPSSAVVTAA